MQWPYCPSLPAAATITACFAALVIAHVSQAIIYRKRFCWVICMATSWETAGFTMRLLGATDPRTQAYSIGSNLLILLSPLWVNAFVYMVVGRMIYYWLPSKSIWRLKARTMTSWFVWIDVILFFVQATGGSMIENEDPNSAKLGLYICKRSFPQTDPRSLANLARHGWNRPSAGHPVSFSPYNDQVQCQRPPGGTRSSYFLATPPLLLIRRPCSHYRAYTPWENDPITANRN